MKMPYTAREVVEKMQKNPEFLTTVTTCPRETLKRRGRSLFSWAKWTYPLEIPDVWPAWPTSSWFRNAWRRVSRRHTLGGLTTFASMILLALFLPVWGLSQDLSGVYSYYYGKQLISLLPSSTYIAVRQDSAALRKKLAEEGVELDPLSQRPGLLQRKIGIYRITALPPGAQRKVEIRKRAITVVKSAGAFIQPVFEQGGALLVPNDEVLVGLTQDSDIAAIQSLLKPHMKALGILTVKVHRKKTYVITIKDPENGRVYSVSRALAKVDGITFAEPNHVVVLLEDGSPQVSTQPLLDKLKAPHKPASRSGRKMKLFSPGVNQTHSSVTWNVLIDESFESNDIPAGWTTGRWDATDPDVYWRVTTHRSHQGTRSIHASSGGSQGVAPPSNYPSDVKSWLETPSLNLTAYEEVYVEIWIYGKFDPGSSNGTFDGGLPYVRENSTGVLTPLDVIPWMSLLFDFSADPTSDHGWRRLLLRVTPAARHNDVQVGFVFISNASDGEEGLYIDQVRVLATTDVDTDPIGNDTYGARQYEFHNAGQIAGHGVDGNDLNIVAAWNFVSVSPEVLVAVVDSGVDLGHPDLRLVTGYDPDGTVGGGPRYPHGTSVAGNVGAIRNNGIGVIGTAPGVKIMPVYMGDTQGEIADALDLAVAKGARIITNSWGLTGAPAKVIEMSIRDALNAGVVMLFAAGNGPDRPPFTYDTVFPCNLTGSTDVICIGASSPSDEYKGSASTDGSTWWGSSYVGNGPDVTAPSPWSYSTDERGTRGYNDGSLIDPLDPGSADYTPVFGGTSSSTPKVAGVVALMLSTNLDLTPAQVKRILRSTADDIDVPGVDDRTGAGRVNAYRAVTQSSLETGEPRGLHVDAVGHKRLARPGNKREAALVLAVNSTRGPVSGLVLKNFRTGTSPVPAGGCNVEIPRVVSTLPGRYLLDVVPAQSNPQCKWLEGKYSISVLVTNGTYSGIGVTNLDVGAN